MLDFGVLPPEVNSARMYAGPGSGSMLAAATAWQELAAELNYAASNYRSVISGLTSGSWTGPSSVSMAAAAAPYVTWVDAVAAQAEQASAQATAAGSAYETAFAATVPPPVIAANRSLLATLVATNILGQNTPAIAATEAHYAEMWAQDAAVMYGYAASSSTASQMTPFTMPPPTTNPAGQASQGVAVAQAVGTAGGTHAETVMSAGPQLISSTPQALQALASPQGLESLSSTGSSTSSASGLSSMSSLSMLTMPARMAMMPMSMLMRMLMMGGMGGTNAAAKTATMEVGAMSSALGGGLGSATSSVGSTGLTGLVSSAPAITADMGRAVAIGPLSVPSGWAGTGPELSPMAAALPSTATGVTPSVQAGAHAGVPPMVPVTNMAGRGAVDGTAPRFELRPSVIPRSPAAG